jgi:hypothetical protein
MDAEVGYANARFRHNHAKAQEFYNDIRRLVSEYVELDNRRKRRK